MYEYLPGTETNLLYISTALHLCRDRCQKIPGERVRFRGQEVEAIVRKQQLTEKYRGEGGRATSEKSSIRAGYRCVYYT